MQRPPVLTSPGPLATQRGQTFPSLVDLMQLLLGPDGCPWDREQDISSLRQYVIEEACEVVDCLEAGDLVQLKEELGDLTLQIVFLSELARKLGAFGPDDVFLGLAEKLIRRHPHVFGEASAETSEDVLHRWDAVKNQEKGRRRLLDGVPRSLPALQRAQTLSERAGRVGFDWPNAAGSREKVEEELAELDAVSGSGDIRRQEHEIGDLLFAIVNLSRHLRVDAEQALRKACDRFQARFGYVESRVEQEHGGWPRENDGKPSSGPPLSVLDEYWRQAKREGL